MIDPFPVPAPSWVAKLVAPLSQKLNLPTLPNHAHEVVLAFAVYQTILVKFSPWISPKLFPNSYHKLSPRTKLNWDAHVVSFVQSLLICGLALYVMIYDEERKEMNWQGRVWGYTGGTGLIEAFGCGYFLWDLYITSTHLSMFGIGMLLHALSALTVFSFGFRPFVNYYAPVFILYELSSPFLNIHWFCDKLDLTGSTTQLINGIFLLGTFFSCRLIYGSYSSICVFIDVWRAMKYDAANAFVEGEPISDIMMYTTAVNRAVPWWLAGSYLASNIVLNCLNWYWMGQMIKTIRKRFEPPFGTKVVEKKREQRIEFEMTKGISEDGTKSVGLEATEVKRRIVPQRMVSDNGMMIP